MSSMFNKTKAVNCPRSWDEYLEAASRLCPQIDGEYNYICVPNQNKTELVQFCLGSGKFPAWQLGEHCPYLHSTGNMNHENCSSFSYGCPRKHYMTREIYKYPSCLEVNTERGCYIADSNCIYNERKQKDETQILYATRICEETENEINNLVEIDGISNDEPNVPLHERGYISEQSSASIYDIKDESNTDTYALYSACKNGKIDACRYLINRYPDMHNQVDDNGWNAALYAAQGGNVKILELLAEKGVDLTYKDKKGCNILHIACINSQFEMCEHIIQHYPDMLKQVNIDGWNSALFAAQGGNVEITKLFAEKDVDMKHKNKHGSNILHIACANSRLEMCKHIIQHYPHMLQQDNSDGLNAAFYAAKGGNVEIIKLLTKKDDNMTYKYKYGCNILHIACASSRLEMCQHIIQHYPDMLYQVDDIGWNTAFCASQGGNVEILKLLTEKGVDMRYKNKHGSNILHIACVYSRLDMCQHIIHHYPDMLKQVDNDGWNAALYAAQGGNVEILELLAEKGVDMTYINNGPIISMKNVGQHLSQR